jgi:hypothetical protein
LVEIHWIERPNLIQFTKENQIVRAITAAALHPDLTNAQSGHRQGRRSVKVARRAAALLTKAQSSVRSDLRNGDNGHHRDDPEH